MAASGSLYADSGTVAAASSAMQVAAPVYAHACRRWSMSVPLIVWHKVSASWPCGQLRTTRQAVMRRAQYRQSADLSLC